MRRPACMDDDEWALWRDANSASPLNHARLESPCVECLPAFAVEMRAEERCDGEPGEPGDPFVTVPLNGRGRAYATAEMRVAALRQTWRDCARRHRMRGVAR